jgi:hypothetical protein
VASLPLTQFLMGLDERLGRRELLLCGGRKGGTAKPMNRPSFLPSVSIGTSRRTIRNRPLPKKVWCWTRPATQVLSGQRTVHWLYRSMLHPMALESPLSTFRSLAGSSRKVAVVAVESGINQVETRQAREIHPPLPSRWTSTGKIHPAGAQEAELKSDFLVDKYETRTEGVAGNRRFRWIQSRQEDAF